MVDVHASRSKCLTNNSSMVVGVGWCLLTDGVPTEGVPTVRIPLKGENVDDMKRVRVKSLCGVAGCLKRSRGGLDGKQVIQFLDHALLEVGRVVRSASAKTTHTQTASRFSCSLGSTKQCNDGRGGETAVKRTCHGLYRRGFPR